MNWLSEIWQRIKSFFSRIWSFLKSAISRAVAKLHALNAAGWGAEVDILFSQLFDFIGNHAPILADTLRIIYVKIRRTAILGVFNKKVEVELWATNENGSINVAHPAMYEGQSIKPLTVPFDQLPEELRQEIKRTNNIQVIEHVQ